MAETPGTGNAFMVDPAWLKSFNCVERGKVSTVVILPQFMGHAITYGNVAYDQIS
jgi:hypothetical protein